MYEYQKKYAQTPHGREALRRARKAYDSRDPERRRSQKRDYMRRKRNENPDIWR
jgi:DNA-binding PadR family transcriptional regulator